MTDPIKFSADKIKVYGPKEDGGYTVTLSVGEYEAQKVALLFALKPDTLKRIEVKDDA